MTPCPKVYREKRPRRPMNKVGPRTRRRNKATAFLRKTVLNWRYCELRHRGCSLYGTDWAHSKKSRKFHDADWETAARACRNCHDEIEAMQPDDMERAVLEAIKRR